MKTKFLFNIDTKIKERLAVEAGFRGKSKGQTINELLDFVLREREIEREQIKKNSEMYSGPILVDPEFPENK